LIFNTGDFLIGTSYIINLCVGGNFMRLLFTVIFIIAFSSLYGQTKSLYNVVSQNGDTSFWYKYQKGELKKLSLRSLDTSTNDDSWRIWTNKQVIEIWQNSEKTYAGKLMTWADEYVSMGEAPTNRTFTKTIQLKDDTVQLLRQMIYSSGILTLPTDDSIKGWQQGTDGITYIIENSSKEHYFFKTYWTPNVQDSLKEAKQVQSFVDSAFTLTNANFVWKEFAKTIPYECWINGGPGVSCKVLTYQEKKKFIKERKNYRQHTVRRN
jgi:hypothetical protein